MSDLAAELQQMRGQIDTRRQEMVQDLREQMAALREHSKVMEETTDEKQLIGEMKKHMQMMDRLLGTLLEQREEMEVRSRELNEQIQSRMKEKLEDRLKELQRQMQSRGGKELEGKEIKP